MPSINKSMFQKIGHKGILDEALRNSTAYRGAADWAVIGRVTKCAPLVCGDKDRGFILCRKGEALIRYIGDFCQQN